MRERGIFRKLTSVFHQLETLGNRFALLTVTGVMFVSLLNGCATNSVIRLSDAALSGDLGAMWEDRQKSVQTGEDLANRGEKRLWRPKR